MSAGRSGPLATGLAVLGLLIAAYLAWTKLSGGLPVCGPLHGCETVALSSYSELFGIPVAAFGVGFSLLLVGASLAWWRRADRRALLGLYGLGLIGVLFVVYLTYLELFVIGAICIWCAGYALTVLTGWLTAAITLRRTPAAER
jgi:uncharacterized membrane protein